MLFCWGPLRTQQNFNTWGLVKLNIAVHKNTGKFASLTKRARSTSFLLISSVKILLRFKKKEEKAQMGDFQVSNLLFLCVRLRVVSNFGDCDCGEGKINTRARESSRRRARVFCPPPQSPSPKLETTRSLPLRANFRCTLVCIALPNTVTALFNQIWINDVTGVAF